jgi:uncharacterized protein YqcC (DUF446 family)
MVPAERIKPSASGGITVAPVELARVVEAKDWIQWIFIIQPEFVLVSTHY